MEFLKSTQLELNPANYLVSKTTGKPVNHAEFVAAQKRAEYVIKLSEAIKDKNFTANKVDSLSAIMLEVSRSLAAANKVAYVAEPTKPTSAVKDELVKFALDFDKYEDEKITATKVNEFMNEFNAINDVEKVGDYFTEGVVKLNKIYTVADVLAAVKSNVAKLGSI